MTKQKHVPSRTFLWIGVFALIASMFVLLLAPRKPAATGPPVRITVDKSGNPQFHGVSLGNTNVRDVVFRGMSSLGLKASLEVGKTITNEAQASNVLKTLEALNRAGLFNTNPPPNPYE